MQEIHLTVLIAVLIVGGKVSADSLFGDVVGKVVVGYQGWFSAPGDNSPLNMWIHWTNPNGKPNYIY